MLLSLHVSSLQKVQGGGMSGITAATATYPLDLIRTRLAAQIHKLQDEITTWNLQDGISRSRDEVKVRIRKKLEVLDEEFSKEKLDASTLQARQQSSWDIFSEILEKTHVVTMPGSGFGPVGEKFVRVRAFGHQDNVLEACRRFKELYKNIGLKQLSAALVSVGAKMLKKLLQFVAHGRKSTGKDVITEKTRSANVEDGV
ncbi:LL-diaminopimelate aminotransferase, chloroplastic, partial [Tanacetum coccineum]